MIHKTSMQHRQLGQVLVSKGILSEDQLRIALIEQTKTKLPLGKLLVALGFVTEAILRDTLSENLGAKSVDLSTVIIDPAALALVPQELAKHHHFLPLSYDEYLRRLTIAIADVNDLLAFDKIRSLSAVPLDIVPLLSGEAEIDRAIDQAYGYALSIDGILNEIETGEADFGGALANEYNQPVVRLIDSILTDAVKRNASDIHFEPEAGFLRIRYRIDGMLRQVRSLHKSYWSAMAVRLKTISGMNIAETRLPQDGRITLNMRGRPIDFRASAQPTIHGENIVLRILDRQAGLLPLDRLGLTGGQLDLLRLVIARPEGVVLLTGPASSGKTTTLYSILNDLNSESVNIMTLEDPVEYPLALIRQTSATDSARLGFASRIRSMMRQNPDILLIGEIRDTETAEMAFRAAMMGCQVFSTLHANSALGAIARLLDMGLSPGMLSGNVGGIVAQRLVRCLCAHCKISYQAEPHELRLLKMDPAGPRPVIFRHGGCARCDFQGYRRRIAIMEILRMNDDLDDLIARRGSLRDIRKMAGENDFVSMADDGLRRVLDGTTSFDELSRVIDLTDRI